MLRHVLIAAVVASAFPAVATAAVPGADGLVAFTVHEPSGAAGFDVVGPDGAGWRATRPVWCGRISARSRPARRPGRPTARGSPSTRRFADAGARFQVSRVDRVTVEGGTNRSPAWSPDGARIAYVGDGELRVLDAGGGVPEPRAPGLAAEDPDWPPDGRIAFAGGRDLCAVAATGGAPVRLLAQASQPAWSPSGRRVAYTAGGEVGVLDLETGGTSTLAGGPGSETAPTWAPVPARPHGPGVEARHAGRIAFTSDRDVRRPRRGRTRLPAVAAAPVVDRPRDRYPVRWAYDAVILADLEARVDPAVAPRRLGPGRRRP